MVFSSIKRLSASDTIPFLSLFSRQRYAGFFVSTFVRGLI